MKNLWDNKIAKNLKTELDMRVYTSRLLGKESSLVLHGGGNTSLKCSEKNIFQETEEILYIKGSGWDLATIETRGFTPLSLDKTKKLATLEKLTDLEMVSELATSVIRSGSPAPSVESILHAILPFKYVDHTHADAIVSITNTPSGEKTIKKIYGHKVLIVPYIMPGFDLARYLYKIIHSDNIADYESIILLNHGVFTFANSAQESYSKMISCISKAESFLKKLNCWNISYKYKEEPLKAEHLVTIAEMRKKISAVTGTPFLLKCIRTKKTMQFANDKKLELKSQSGPATPDHIIRTKMTPLIGQNIEKFSENYKKYFNNHSKKYQSLEILDSAPRVILDPVLGMLCAGRNIHDVQIIQDIYDHTIDIIERASLLESYQSISPQDLFAMEYWSLEQAKLKKQTSKGEFTGEIALVTGAASGIGKAISENFLKNGSVVIGIDMNPHVETLFKSANFKGYQCDLTDEKKVKTIIQRAILDFGGIDMLILNAGIFPESKSIKEMNMDYWENVFRINLNANITLLRNCYPFLKLAPSGGRVVVIGSKNVPAPGPGASAYSASKAALTQVARIVAMEWGKDQIRINTVHPNQVFDTGIWNEETIKSRAAQYNMSIQEYQSNNILKTTITSQNVAELVRTICSSAFSKTTGAQIPIDGGNERII